MSLRPDGSYRCDKCGADVGNGGVHLAAVVSDLDQDGSIRVLHFCRDHVDGEETVKGCARRVLTAKALADYLTTRGEQ